MAAKRRKKIVSEKKKGIGPELQTEFRRVIDAINDGICLLSTDQKIQVCNRAMATLFGMRLEEMTGRYCYEVVYGTDRPVPGCTVEKMRKSLMRETMELERNGRWFDVTVDPLLDETGELAGILHIVREITERKKTENALRESEEKYRILAESSPEMIYLVDREGIVRYVNNTAIAMFKGGRNAVVGKRVADLYPAAVAERHLKAIRAVVATGESIMVELLEGFPTGKRWIDARLSPVKDSTGTIFGVLGLSADITARKNMEQELIKSQEHYQDLVETAQNLIFQCNAEGKYIYLNPAWESVLGYTLDEMLNHPFTEFMPEDKAQQALRDFTRNLSKGFIKGYETEYLAKDGRRVHLICNGKFIKEPDGTVSGMSGTAYDITERKKAEEALAQSEEKFRAIIEQGSEGIILIDEQCRVIEWNPAMERITGVAFTKAKGRPVWEVQGMTALPERWTPQRAEQFKEMFLGAIKTGWSPLFNTPIEAVMVRHGEQVHIQQTIFPIKTEKGYRLGSITRDVTDRKKAEATLRRSEEKYKALFESAGDAITIARIEKHGPRFIDVNSRVLELFGMTREELIGADPAALSPKLQADGRVSAEAVLEDVAKAMSGETVVFEWLHRKKDGTDFPCEVTLSAIEFAGERVIQAIIRDITERKRLEERMARDEKLESLQVFAGGIAHDFNNLLAGIFGNIDLARVELPDDNPAQRYLNNSFLAFGRARHLAQQLLTFAKGGAPQKRPLRLSRPIMNACALALSGSNVKAEYCFAEGLWPVEADENQLSQVFSNLVINAWQAMPQGGIVTITAENHTLEAGQAGELPAGKYVAVMVEDRGIGIPQNIIDKIFDPFFTTKQQGSGLGLATSFSIIGRHNGTLEVVSEPGRGTVFTIMLPATDKEVADDESAGAISDLRGSGRILVMDDEGLIRRIVYDMLSMAGYEVTTASEGREVIHKYREALDMGKRYDAVILDLTVPGGMGGMETARELLAIDPGVLAIVSSGYSDSAGMSHYADHGFAARVPKPYSLKELLSTVKNVLESRKNK